MSVGGACVANLLTILSLLAHDAAGNAAAAGARCKIARRGTRGAPALLCTARVPVRRGARACRNGANAAAGQHTASRSAAKKADISAACHIIKDFFCFLEKKS